MTVTGDDVYTVNIDANSSITSVENLGSETGVTVGGLSNSILITDAAGALTVDKTFASGASVTYTVTDGKISAADGVTTISGDFANGVAVNETPYTISGGTVTIDASTGNVAANAGSYTLNGKTYTTSTPTTFSLSGGTVTGADMDGVGNFAIHQDETGFALDDDTLNLSGNSVVTLGLSSDSVNTAHNVKWRLQIDPPTAGGNFAIRFAL